MAETTTNSGLLTVRLVTPDRVLLDATAEAVELPAMSGYIEALYGHAPLLTELGTGFMYYVVGGKRTYFSIHGGFAEVLPDRVRMLANGCERADEIDVERARRALERAQRELENPALGVDPAAALAAIARAQARLDAAAQR